MLNLAPVGYVVDPTIVYFTMKFYTSKVVQLRSMSKRLVWVANLCLMFYKKLVPGLVELVVFPMMHVIFFYIMESIVPIYWVNWLTNTAMTVSLDLGASNIFRTQRCCSINQLSVCGCWGEMFTTQLISIEELGDLTTVVKALGMISWHHHCMISQII